MTTEIRENHRGLSGIARRVTADLVDDGPSALLHRDAGPGEVERLPVVTEATEYHRAVGNMIGVEFIRRAFHRSLQVAEAAVDQLECGAALERLEYLGFGIFPIAR